MMWLGQWVATAGLNTWWCPVERGKQARSGWLLQDQSQLYAP